MSLPAWGWSALAGLVVGGLGVNLYWLDQRRAEHASAQATLDAANSTIASLRSSQGHLDTLWRVRDSIVVRKELNYDSTRALALDWAERLATHDTVSVETIKEVVRTVVLSADSAEAACSALRVTCAEQRAVLLQRIAADSTILRATTSELSRARIRSRLGCFAGGVGAVIQGTVKAGFGVGCGLRVW